MAKFRSYNPVLAFAARQIIPDELLRQVISVTFCRINQINTQLSSLIQHGIDFNLSEILAPLSAKLPSP
ncbi:hypothetical protein D3C75_679950 [compost metagenome]